MEQAIAALEGRPASAASRQDERMDAFRASAKKTLQRLPRGILLPTGMAILLERAQERYGIDPASAETVLRELAQVLRISVISRDQALAHLEQLIEHLFAAGDGLSPQQQDRVTREAAQWGLSTDEALQCIANFVQSQYQRRQAEAKWARTALLAAGVAALLLLVFLVWVLVDSATQPRALSLSAEARPVAALPPAPPPDRDDAWWNAELSVVVASLRLELPPLRSALDELAAADPQRRAAAYQQLVRFLFENVDSDTQRWLFVELLSRCYALDPSEPAVEGLASALLDDIPGPEARLEGDARRYQNAFWSLRVATAALRACAQAAPRAQSLALQIGQGVGTTIDPEALSEDVEQHVLGALAERLYRLLIVSLESETAPAEALHPAIAGEAKRYLDRRLLDKLNADFLLALLSAHPQRYVDYESAIGQVIRSPNPVAAVRMVELLEATEDEELREFLAPRVLSRADVIVDRPLTVSEIAVAVRRGLGIAAGPEGFHSRLTAELRRQLGKPRAAANDPVALMQETLEFSRLATLGWAAEHEDRAAGLFEQWLNREPPDLSRHDSAAPARVTLEARSLDRDLLVLRRPTSSLEARRDRIAMLASHSDSVALSPAQAEELAAYLLRRKAVTEIQALKPFLASLGKYQHLRLQLADNLSDATLPEQELHELIAGVLGEDAATFPKDRQTWPARLLASVARELSHAAADDAVSQLLPTLRDSLRAAYQDQLTAWGGVAETSEGTTEPAALLRALVQIVAQRLDHSGLSERERRELQNLTHEFAAQEFTVENELQHTVLLERTYLRVLALAARSRSAAAGRQAQELVERVRTQDRTAENLLVQLRDGHVALAELAHLMSQP